MEKVLWPEGLSVAMQSFTRKYSNIFGISLVYSYLSPMEKILSLERTKKNEFSFGSLLAYSYLCTPYEEMVSNI